MESKETKQENKQEQQESKQETKQEQQETKELKKIETTENQEKTQLSVQDANLIAYSWQQVKAHNTTSSCWVVWNDNTADYPLKIYDITSFLDQHTDVTPTQMLQYCVKSATEVSMNARFLPPIGQMSHAGAAMPQATGCNGIGNYGVSAALVGYVDMSL
ncbi:Cytochrome b5-like heme/steroid binding domain [Pseudocohnilembus persalinus]|uniref:Cytochrome b5-like heme/steroid binding domain n=1 Tax=Pseudocohnilembus persalinus TaxID=266149 RepID=A0A0V0R1V0_PSEPJ|nr:Cytochrome b5-like heme/steroid binding domain [Pseudocohnilembus persalinus]|eukprot:KRX08502.1 Cytochrome b5-like heme/steroid binding domain [Pseudocohnilembus persalinus]